MPHADLGDVELYYRSYGEGSPVLGVMGFGLDQRYWAAQVPAIAESNRFITFDHRGSGRSTRVDPGSLQEMAADGIRLLDHLEIDKAVVFGASMGGAIAQHMALSYPERVRALILAITWARPIEFMRRQHEAARLVFRQLGSEAFAEVSLLWMFTPPFFEIGREAIDRLIQTINAPGSPEMMGPDALEAQLDALTSHDVLDRLPKISCPTLVAGGRMDIMVPGFASEEIARAIPGAELEMFETGHGLMFEEMDAFNARIRKFLDRLEG